MEYRYNEGEILKQLTEYVDNTYGEHYAAVEADFQIQDVFEHLKIAEPFCRANAIKYLYRFGDKEGKNKKDLLKALHYTILLYHFSGMDKKSTEHEQF
tara:strand:- start:117 stop:410 length:294 start_codon:yes stop_codon:yes gene_type:complete